MAVCPADKRYGFYAFFEVFSKKLRIDTHNQAAMSSFFRLCFPIPQHLPTKGIEKLLESVHQVRRGINPSLKIEGILMTLMDGRTVYEREISEMIRKAYGGKINIFGTEIPRSVRAAETSAEGKSIFAYAPRSKVAEAYRQLTKEVLALEKQREEHRAEIGR